MLMNVNPQNGTLAAVKALKKIAEKGNFRSDIKSSDIAIEKIEAIADGTCQDCESTPN
jgi:hypothetical protein